MRVATYRHPGSEHDRVGVVVGDVLHALPGGSRLLDLLGDDGERLASAGDAAVRDPHEVVEVAAVRLLPPVPVPPSLRDFYAFEQHVRTARQRRGLEMDPDWYRLPVFYFSNPRALIGDGDAVAIPPGSGELDFEL
ncbi:MAG TPA: fumarylacetoacetate hydrolase family protein, partial [Candidatus Dormibacteraeota bacterium]